MGAFRHSDSKQETLSADREDVQHHAKTIMTLVDHDHETFGGRYKLDISNFQDVIDYGKIMNTSVQKMQDEWIQQVQSNAEKRDFSYISLAV